MISFALYGRVGQGVRSAARVLAKAAFYSGYQVQCLIPYANSVQTGFVKIDKAPIASRELVEPDFFLVFDMRIASFKNVKQGAVIIANAREKPMIKTKNNAKVFYVNASDVALAAKSRIPNMAMLGALAKAFGKLPMKHLRAAAEEEGLQAMHAFEEGFRSVKR